jgi:two-component sensor histidine kinase
MHRELAAVGDDLAAGGDFLRGILAGCGDCIKVLDLEGRLQFMSEGGKRVMEVENFAALQGCPWPDFWAGEGNAQAHEAVAAARQGRTARFRNAANTAKGTPRFWDVQVSPIMGPDGKVSHILSISRDITQECEAVARQKFLSDELTHRVQNTLATVIAIAGQTFRGEMFDERRDVFNARIRTLSEAYNILSDTAWAASSVRSVVESALRPYRNGPEAFEIAGDEYPLRPVQALTLALAINELATNAVKYGALSAPAGKVTVSWSSEPEFQFEWREQGGPPVIAPTRKGFGTMLIRKMLASDFNGTVDLRHDVSGVICVLTAPVDLSPGA